jgi:transcriptional regulator with XRE-family HTH domain
MPIGDRIRDLRWDRHLKQGELAQRAGIAQNTLSQIELGKTTPSVPTLEKIARGLNLDLSKLLLEEPVLAGELGDGPSLEELHKAAGCRTDWLTKPEEEWRASWPLSLTPLDAMQIVQEMALELAALKPLLAAQERDLPIYKRAISGPYRQAWLRLFEGMQAAHKCGVANGLITQEETLNDLENRLELGEGPGVRYEGMMYAS